LSLTGLQYYKPWETTNEDNDRIQDQIAEVHDIIKREVEEYEARQEEEKDRERRASQGADASRDTAGSDIGKEPAEDTNQQPATTNGFTNGSHNSTRDQDMHDDHEHDPDHQAVRNDGASQDSAGHETIADELMKDMADDNDVIEEAAEDTVIY
jgi:hypothetical protein